MSVIFGAPPLPSLLAVTLASLWAEKPRLATGLCLAALSFEMLFFAYDYNPSIPRSAYYPETPGIRALRDQASPSRAIGLGKVLPANTPALFGLHDVRGGDFMTVRRYEELIRGEAGDFRFMNWTSELPAKSALLAVEYVVVPGDAEFSEPSFQRVYRGEISVYQRRPSPERALILRKVEVLPVARELLSVVRSDGFDPRELLLLAEPPPPLGAEDRGATITSRSPTSSDSSSRAGMSTDTSTCPRSST